MTKVKTEQIEVRFYRASENPYGAFSNLYRREIEFRVRNSRPRSMLTKLAKLASPRFESG